MAYRNGTYVAFHAEGISDPTASDIRYFNILKAWHHNAGVDFRFVNSHDKVAAVRDSSKKETLRRSLISRLNNSKNMLLIVGQRTKYDRDWVPFEIEYAIDNCGIPIIIAYTGYTVVVDAPSLATLWPSALTTRINLGSVKAMHIPFQRLAIDEAVTTFDINNPPRNSLMTWSIAAHRQLGIRA